MKKITAIFLAIIIFAGIGLFPISGIVASALEITGTEPEPNENGIYVSGDFAYKLLEDGTAMLYLYNPAKSGHVIIPESFYGHTVVKIGDAFNKNVTGVTIPNTVKYIGTDAFAGCIGLKSIELPDSVESIGTRAFVNCQSLETLIIGSGLKTVADNAFSLHNTNQYTGLKEFIIDEENPYYSSQDGVWFNKDKTTLIKYPYENERKVYEIPEGVETIAEEAFHDCIYIRKIVFPSTMKTVKSGAFSSADKLSEIVLNDGLEVIDGGFGQTDLRTLQFPESVTKSGRFGSTTLKYIAVPESHTGSVNFMFSHDVVSIYLPKGVNEFGHQAFDYTYKLTDIYYAGTQEEFANIPNCGCEPTADNCNRPEAIATIHYNHTHTLDRYYVVKAATPESKGVADHACVCGYSVREEYEYEPNSIIEGYCGHDMMWNFDFETGALTVSGEGDMYDYWDITEFPWYGIKDRIKTVEISEGITSISEYAFENCNGITEMIFPESVTTIGDYAFSGCSGIEKIDLHENIVSIGENTFAGCSGMKEFYVSKNLETFSEKYLKGLTNLEKLYVDYDHPTYYTDDFGALFKRRNLTSTDTYITLVYYPPCAPYGYYSPPETMVVVGENAFKNSKNLKSVYVPKSLTKIGDSAFAGCNITDIYYSGTEDELGKINIGANNDVLNTAIKHTKHTHSLTETDNKPETCTENGYIKNSCDCGYIHTEILVKTGHKESDWIYKANGVYVKTCQTCGEDYDSKSVELRLSRSEVVLSKTYTHTLGWAVENESRDKVVFTSSNKNVAIVDAKGKITAVGKGEAIITATIEGTDVSKTCKVTVKPSQYTVTWVVNGVETTERVTEGEPIPLHETPQIEGYTFVDWTPQVPATMPPGNIYFYAVFNQISKAENFDVSATYLPGCFNEDVTLDVAEIQGDKEPGGVYMVEGEYYKQVGLYNIKTVNENGEVVQPNNGYKVTIRLAIPEAYKNNKTFMVYHRFTGGGREQLSTENGTIRIENGYLVFDVTKFSEFEIFVPSPYIKITQLPAKTVYYYNTAKELDLTGIRIRYTKVDGTTKTLTDSSPLTVTGFDCSKVGKQTVTVKYGQYSDTFEVTVKYNWWQWIINVLFLGLFKTK